MPLDALLLFATGAVKKHYFFGGKLVAMREGGGVRFLLTDHASALLSTGLGSVNVVLDTNGNVDSQLRYDPWGKQRYALDVTPTGYRYTAQRWDSGLGLYDYNARYYDPHIGRFISADTLVPDPAAPQAFNRYAYVLGNPLRYTDPTGHIPIPAIILLLAMVGTTVGVLDYMHVSDLNLKANPASSTRGVPNVIMLTASASAGSGIGTEAGVSNIYHLGSDTYATCLNTCSEFTSQILGASGSISFAWTDARTARDVASGYTTSVSLGVGPISIGKWNTATELWHPPMATARGTTGLTVSSGVDVSPVNVTSSTCYCTVTSAGSFSEMNLPFIVQFWNKIHDFVME